MKNLRMKTRLVLASITAATAIGAAAIAGQVGEIVFVPLGNNTGTAAWTNTHTFAAVDLHRVSVVDNLGATNAVTAKRVIKDIATGNMYTQSVGVVNCSSGAGTQATLAYDVMRYGDVIQFSSFTPTGGTAIVEYDVQRHYP